MRRVLPIMFLMMGCTPLSTAVIGPTPSRALALWRGTDAREMDERRDGRLVPMTWSQALGVGLDPTWALIDFHDDEPARTDVVVVSDLHRVDDGVRFPPLGPLVERAISRHAIWVTSHDEETAAAFAPADPPAPDTVIEAMGWSTDRIVLTLTTTFAGPCSGIAWPRTYDITRDGTVTPITEDAHRPLPSTCDAPLP